jgi:hypothetical protein
LIAVALLAFIAKPDLVAAQDMSQKASSASGIGVGIESMITGPTGPAVVYQTPAFHVDAILGLYNTSDSQGREMLLAGRFWYQLHSGLLADFNIGAGLGLLSFDGGDDIDPQFDLGAKIRAFLAPNVALSASLGLAMVLQEDETTSDRHFDYALTGDLIGSMGIVYFFF